MIEPGSYVRTLRHRRISPRRHEFTYPLFLVFLDVDRIPELMRVSRITSYDRANVVSYRETDHFGDSSLTLRERILRDARRQGFTVPEGNIFLLTHLRYFGYNFNPVSFFYFYNQHSKFSGVLAEVTNTFAETHNYCLCASGSFTSRTAKGEFESATSGTRKYSSPNHNRDSVPFCERPGSPMPWLECDGRSR